MCTVTSCMQTSQPALSFTTTLDQTAIPTFSSSPANQELQHLHTPLPTHAPQQEHCNLALHLCGCSLKLFLEGGLVTLSKAIERLWVLLLKKEVFHSGARTLSRGALTVVKPLPEEYTNVCESECVCVCVHSGVQKHWEGFLISEDLSPCLSLYCWP